MTANARLTARSGPVRLEDLGLTDEQLASIAVSDAKRAVRGLEELGREPRPALRRLADGDAELIAAFVARYTSVRHGDAA